MVDRPKVDIMFLTDATGSMSNAIANVKADMIKEYRVFINELGDLWDVRIGLAWYRDLTDSKDVFDLAIGITDNTNRIQNGIDNLVASGGGDTKEAQLLALHEIATAEILGGWRSGSNRYIAWYGDQPGHNPVGYNGHQVNLSQVKQELNNKRMRVLAFSMAPTDNLNGENQVTEIINTTGGQLWTNVKQDNVVNEMYEKIRETLRQL